MFVRTTSFVTALLLRSAISTTGFQASHTQTVARSFATVTKMATNKEVSVGDTLPAIQLTELTANSPEGKPATVDLNELCKGKKVAIFGVP